ncbi:MAG TPA: response regulator [Burkholderiales bacterium]|jgi:FixJ family two-component response regulator
MHGVDNSCVHVIDDDVAVLNALARLLGAAGLPVQTFASAKEFFAQHSPEQRGCLVLDLLLPGASGLEVQEALAGEDCPLPVVFLSGHGDVVASVRAMKAGAVDFLTKPFEAEALIAAVRQALARDGVAARVASLTPRERQVLGQLVEGKLNKQIAAELGASEKTIKVHRARVLQKMAARSIAGLVRMTERAGLKAAAK